MDDCSLYRVIVNWEDEHAIWPATQRLPSHWRDTGVIGDKADCVAYIRRLDTTTNSAEIRRIVEHGVMRP